MEVTAAMAAMAAMAAVAEIEVMAAMTAMAVIEKKYKFMYMMSLQFCEFFSINPCSSINGVEGKAGYRAGEKETIEFSHPFWIMHRFGIGVCYCS